MTIRKVYFGSLGPFLYDDIIPIDDVDGDFAGEDQKGLITDGPVKVENTPATSYDVLRFDDLGELIVSAQRTTETFIATGTIAYLTNVVLATGTYDLFLPTLVLGEKRVYDVKNDGVGVITLKPNATEPAVEIEGEVYQTLRPGDSVSVWSDLTDWSVL